MVEIADFQEELAVVIVPGKREEPIHMFHAGDSVMEDVIVDSAEKAEVENSSAAISNGRQNRCMKNLASGRVTGVYQGERRVTRFSRAPVDGSPIVELSGQPRSCRAIL